MVQRLVHYSIIVRELMPKTSYRVLFKDMFRRYRNFRYLSVFGSLAKPT